ncbi:hypothetical protein [Mycoplasma zalophi]|uniref:hypothetical protein n=1 Tax=Mycoplasma zalophi TaxID=191287 RepID=UPI001C1088EA|nr:hypothetical protein [Mycoplasma zalophi]MBU4690830.1 hypothetical protein [Mycoplasma zalophi]
MFENKNLTYQEFVNKTSKEFILEQLNELFLAFKTNKIKCSKQFKEDIFKIINNFYLKDEVNYFYISYFDEELINWKNDLIFQSKKFFKLKEIDFKILEINNLLKNDYYDTSWNKNLKIKIINNTKSNFKAEILGILFTTMSSFKKMLEILKYYPISEIDETLIKIYQNNLI